MFRVIDCITQDHDLRLVVLAGVLCLFACGTAMSLVGRSRASTGRVRAAWIAGAGFVAGSGIWATHFVAMLAYQTSFPLDYNIALTISSVVIAIALCGGGFALAVIGGRPFAGGALTGSAIGIMHYVGMAAVRAPAHEIWDFRYVAISLAIGILAMAFGMLLVMRNKELRGYLLGATIFTLAICSMHFTGMSAVTFRYDPLIAATTGILAPDTLAVAIAAIAALILGLGLVTAVVDHHLAARAESEADRLRKYIVELEATKSELEQSLRERAIALTKADMASRSKSAFLAAMSHELRTPLNAIIGFSEMMSLEAWGPLGSPLYQNYSQDIHHSGKHLLSLISDILDISRLEAGKADLHEESVDLATLMSDCLRMVENQAENGDLSLETDLPRDLPRVLADERRLKQVLLNLLSNAIKFTQRCGRIVVQVRVSDEGVYLSVEDTGVGIAPEDITRAFENFSQVDSNVARHRQGAGLGLPLSRQLMELHGGTLVLESVVGVGTIATAVLPASRILAISRAA